MSTKCTLAHGEGFHLYEEQMERTPDGETNTIRLELDNVNFEVYPNNITVSIPLDVWEYIRHYTLVSYDYVDLSDDELYEQAQERAETRLRWTDYQTLEECIEGTFEVFKKRREKQRKMREQQRKLLGSHPLK